MPTEPWVTELFSLRGRVALVTGGSKGLGLSIATGLAEAGAVTVLASRNLEDCDRSAAELERRTGVPSFGARLDVTDEADVAKVFRQVMKKHGRLDVLVNSAGVNVRALIEECSLETFEQVVGVNLIGTWLCCREAGRLMKASGVSGSVINLGSALSSIGIPMRSPYCSSKAGVIGLTQTVALEWAETGLRCNALCPGPFRTGMNLPVLEDPERTASLLGRIPVNRWAELVDIRGPAVFLASDASRYMTGAALYIDGGWTAQ
ncbi:MAG TPA: SDR family oxidoreductase [Acidimicrobiales bacterium]|nr:SDR family oxidoreductase [Acidimicrobiales bacterium]